MNNTRIYDSESQKRKNTICENLGQTFDYREKPTFVFKVQTKDWLSKSKGLKNLKFWNIADTKLNLPKKKIHE